MPKKLNNKVKIASDKTKTKQKKLHLFQKILHQTIIWLSNIYTKEQNQQS